MAQTPAQLRGLELLEWLKTTRPVIKGETVGLIERRRKRLVAVLKEITVSPEGCLFYGDPSFSTRSEISWPIIAYPRGVKGPVGSRAPVAQRALARLLLDLYFPTLKKPTRLNPTCGHHRCVNLQHIAKAPMKLREPRLTREEFREVALMVRRDGKDARTVAELTGYSLSAVRNICCGGWHREWIADILEEFVPIRGNVQIEASRVREIYMVAYENPSISATALARKMGVAYPTVLAIVRGQTHKAVTEDLREMYPNER